ncbi:MAG: 50S ribosomal protein L31 [Vampirovibrionales bacterium]
MKKQGHPTVYRVLARCANCKSEFYVNYKKPELTVEICASCHPAFKGDTRGFVLDTEGRVEKFNKRFKKAAQA